MSSNNVTEAQSSCSCVLVVRVVGEKAMLWGLVLATNRCIQRICWDVWAVDPWLTFRGQEGSESLAFATAGTI